MTDKPQTLGAAIDTLHERQKLRASIEREHDASVAKMKAEENELEQFIVLTLQREGMTGSRGTKAQVSVRPKTVPQVQDWLAFFDYIAKNNAFQLVQKRIGVTAWAEMVAAGETIPGVKSETFSVLSVTKIA
jgi:hypothetical protein